MALLAWRLGSGDSNQQDDCCPDGRSYRQVWRGVRLPEFTCCCLELSVAPGRGAAWLQACPTSGPKEPPEVALERKQEPSLPTPLLLQWAAEAITVILLGNE